MQPELSDPAPPARPARRGIGLGLVLVCLGTTLVLGAALKEPCAGGGWSDGRQYRWLCYSDIVPLLGAEQLATGNRLPYLDPCVERPEGNCDEYPVLSMYTMRLAAWLSPSTGPPIDGAASSRSHEAFFHWNVAILAIAAVATTLALYLMVGRRALYFALAPTLLIYGFVNWDLLAVAFATLGTLAYIERRDGWSGALLGLGAAAKMYPALLIPPFVLGRFRDRRPVGGTKLAWTAAASWLVVNLPFMVLAAGGWWEFFRFNSQRIADWDSLWYIACDRIPGVAAVCSPANTTALNVISFVLFLGISVLLWRIKVRRQPDFPRWTFAFPLLVVFLLTNKVYSPQYGLWLLPWFALVFPDLRTFVAFSAADVAVFVTRFAFFGQLDPAIGGWVNGFTIGWFQVAVLVRTLVLIWCVVAWVLRDQQRLPAELRSSALDEHSETPAPSRALA
jgi:uncharacterized membrane protein